MYDNLCGSENNHAYYFAMLLWASILIWVATSLRPQMDRGPAGKHPPNLAEGIPGGNIIRLIRGIDFLAEAMMLVYLIYIAQIFV